MRHTYAVLAIVGLAGGFGPAAAQDPAVPSALELADRGFLECHDPNARQKTCSTIVAYERLQDGVYSSTTVFGLGSGATIELYTPVWSIDGAFCGTIREQDLMTGIIRVGDREVPPRVAAPVLQRALQRLRPFLDQEFCTRYESEGDGYAVRTSIGDEHVLELDTHIRMVDPAEGYRVPR